MSISQEIPKLVPFYSNKMVKNFFQPFYDIVNAQSMWTDAMSRWFTDFNKSAIAYSDKHMKRFE